MSRLFRFAIALILLAATNAQAQLFRTYLASDGNDANPCTLVAPCRLLPAALAAVSAGGQIWILDSANYNTGTVAIAKSVSILAVPGAVASVIATGGGPAINISANAIAVGLRNVFIGPFAGGMPGTHGVAMMNAILALEDSEISSLPGDGISAPIGGVVRITNSTIRNIGGYAVQMLASSGENFFSVASSRLQDSGGGVFAWASDTGSVVGTVSDSILANLGFAVRAFTDSANGVARLAVTRSTIERASAALYSNTNGAGIASIAISSSMLANNNSTWIQQGAGTTIFTLNNNHHSGQSGVNSGSLTTMSPL